MCHQMTMLMIALTCNIPVLLCTCRYIYHQVHAVSALKEQHCWGHMHWVRLTDRSWSDLVDVHETGWVSELHMLTEWLTWRQHLPRVGGSVIAVLWQCGKGVTPNHLFRREAQVRSKWKSLRWKLDCFAPDSLQTNKRESIEEQDLCRCSGAANLPGECIRNN